MVNINNAKNGENIFLLHDTITTEFVACDGRIKVSFTTAKIIVFKMQEVEIHCKE